MLEIDGLHFLPIHVRSIVTSKVSHPADRRIDFDEEMQAGKIGIIIRHAEVSAPGTTRQEQVMFGEDELLALMRAFQDTKTDTHSVFLTEKRSKGRESKPSALDCTAWIKSRKFSTSESRHCPFPA
jgi:hypothetical protein